MKEDTCIICLELIKRIYCFKGEEPFIFLNTNAHKSLFPGQPALYNYCLYHITGI